MAPEAAPRRVFVALVLPPALGEELARLARAALGEEGIERRYRLPRAAGLHLTLLFLGDLAPAALDGLVPALRAGIAGRRAPRLVLDRAGTFPERGRARVLWVGAREEAGAGGRLAALHEAVLGAAEGAGFDAGEERGRPFHPHVTVARPRVDRRGRGASVPEAFRALAPGLVWRPVAAALVESLRGAGPARYAVLHEFPLEGA